LNFLQERRITRAKGEEGQSGNNNRNVFISIFFIYFYFFAHCGGVDFGDKMFPMDLEPIDVYGLLEERDRKFMIYMIPERQM
jgi:hypothetical protein